MSFEFATTFRPLGAPVSETRLLLAVLPLLLDPREDGAGRAEAVAQPLPQPPRRRRRAQRRRDVAAPQREAAAATAVHDPEGTEKNIHSL